MAVPGLYETEEALVAACVACEGAEALVVVLGSAEELGQVVPGGVPVGFVVGRNLGALLIAPGALAQVLEGADFAALHGARAARESSTGDVRGPLVCWGRPGARRVASVEVWQTLRALEAAAKAPTPPQSTRAGVGRLIGESEQRAAVEWAEGLAAEEPGVSSDYVYVRWGGDPYPSSMTAPLERRLPAVGAVARALFFDAVVVELLAQVRRAHPEVPRLAVFVGACLCRVWTATGGALGGPAEVRLDDGERRADVCGVGAPREEV